MEISSQQKITLLGLAEWSITDYILTGAINQIPERFTSDPVFGIKMGAFVSVYIRGKLRGCIGTFSESEPLFKNVRHMALQAATEDHRFKPVIQNELKNLKLEISVLLPRRRIKGPEDIIIGKHGIYMTYGFRKATLLPQVASKNGWNAIQFLECCAENKLGLTKDSWKEAELYVYEAVVF